MTDGSLLAVCRVHQLLPDSGSVGVTAIDKRPVDGKVKVRRLGLRSDVQANREHHGGEDQALYAYSREDADVWALELGRAIPPGLFGENLRTAGVGTTTAVIGERWRIGPSVVVEVTSPRVPCSTFQRRMREQRWVRRFTEAGLIGTYLRVVRTGEIAAGDGIEVLSRPGHGVTVGDWFSNGDAGRGHRLLAAEQAGELTLASDMHISIAKALGRSR
ncbi:MOSC domain-containing protein [Paenarthrobacter sp. DKR-5]|uniref:MOSC domain-containing protein n=1 Tax=Paenarthrobacter sp. DKR-5 TaxID=2835535 RepID=UPI001BDCD2D4|nr:MOSC domain-containing protein [Paenarthrobacter sp. DKR-5]MBT1001156.1 MOSC domain-containing protein [Paenarthrobacter sp. DKR-5]